MSVASLLPLVQADAWFVRVLDFTRLQMALVLVALLILAWWLGLRRSLAGGLTLAAGVLALVIHGTRLAPFTPLGTVTVPGAGSCAPGDRLRLLVANVQKSDESADRLLALIAEAQPDLILAMETDAWWDDALRSLADTYPEAIQHIPGEDVAYGIHLLSRLPLSQARAELWFDAITPTILADVTLPSGQTAELIGLHPRPPLPPDQSSTMRDAHILQAALAARDTPAPSILAGDFNAVSWEPVFARALRLGDLSDPRVGRGLYPTFSAESWWMAWPLDHVVTQPGIALAGWAILPAFGSDHHPVLADLCVSDAADAGATQVQPGDAEAAERAIRAAAALGARDSHQAQ